MDNPVPITHPDQMQAFVQSDLHWPYDPCDLVRDEADAHWIYLNTADQPAARCSLWWHQTPVHAGHRVGFIGHYAATDIQPARKMLAHACRQLGKAGCTLAVGPVDGSTWRRYRCVTEHGSRPAFFLEPSNPPAWPAQWEAAGFSQVAEYHSGLNSDLSYEDPRGREAGQRLCTLGVRVRSLDPAQFEQELAHLYPMIVRSFKGSFLYSPISLETFIAQNQAVRSCLRPELIRIAEHRDQPVGLLFGVPDILQASRGETIDTAMIKTLVITPERAYAGLGSYLTLEYHRICRDLGYKHVIHALMHQSSKSQNISARYGPVMRRYALFAKPL